MTLRHLEQMEYAQIAQVMNIKESTARAHVRAGREALRGMLARLQPKEEVLLLGWGVPMPLPVKSRRYDDTFWETLFGKKPGKRDSDDILKELGF